MICLRVSPSRNVEDTSESCSKSQLANWFHGRSTPKLTGSRNLIHMFRWSSSDCRSRKPPARCPGKCNTSKLNQIVGRIQMSVKQVKKKPLIAWEAIIRSISHFNFNHWRIVDCGSQSICWKQSNALYFSSFAFVRLVRRTAGRFSNLISKPNGT